MPLDPHEVQAETVRYLVAKNQELAAEVARLQDLADARLYRARAAQITLESVGCPRSEPVDVGAARAAGMIEDLRAEVARLTAALAAAQAERDRLAADAQRWAMIRDTVTRLDAESRPGLPMGDDDIEQVVLRVLERTARKPAPVATQVVRLHQAYEGTKVCLHCGKPQPWPEMDRCPRAPKDLRALAT